MLSRDDIGTIINALILAELNVDEHIQWNQASRREYLDGIRLARSNVAKEQRRARKAAKNLVMYKLAGRRPWRWVNQICGARYILKQQSPDILRWSLEAYDWDREDMQYPLSHLARRRNVHSHRIAWLRERSGFLAMSRLAEGMR